MANKEITLSIMPAAREEAMRLVLDQFEAEKRIKVNLVMIDWVSYRTRLVDIAVHSRGADVSAVTVPSTSDMIGMNALRPFSPIEIIELGGASSYIPSAWNSVVDSENQRAWAIPWLIDCRYIFYWPEMLQAAGIDESTAFSTRKHVSETTRKLMETGLDVPYAVPTEAYQILHAISSYIWETGGDVIKPDGSEVTFHKPEALNAISEYFDMIRPLPQQAYGPAGANLFFEKKAAFTISGGWFLNRAQGLVTGCVGMPGGSYLGGTNLVIWKHTQNTSAAFELVKWLSRPDVQLKLSFPNGYLPSRMSLLTDPELLAGPVTGPRIRASETGRIYPCVPMIGLVEDRFSQELARVQRELPNRAGQDTAEVVRSIIEPLGRRLNLALGSGKTTP